MRSSHRRSPVQRLVASIVVHHVCSRAPAVAACARRWANSRSGSSVAPFAFRSHSLARARTQCGARFQRHERTERSSLTVAHSRRLGPSLLSYSEGIGGRESTAPVASRCQANAKLINIEVKLNLLEQSRKSALLANEISGEWQVHATRGRIQTAADYHR
eukprot:4351730-Pleurochrysis_carterae.AAC.1